MHELRQVLEALAGRKWTLAVAESDTGGLLLGALTGVAGSSAVVLGGVVAYHDRLKRELLGVPAELLERHGAVSGEVARAMVSGARTLAGSDLGLSTTGIAGPGGGTPIKPVGLAFVAAVSAEQAVVRRHVWTGDRDANRQSSARAALRLALELLGERPANTEASEHMCYDTRG